ncbi:MAG: hypothetical protein IKD76_03985 [Clostridia bacterium]|nr:hypothetical protein [Clostridia bacterium]
MVRKILKILLMVFTIVVSTNSIVNAAPISIYSVGSNGFTSIGSEVAGYVYYIALALAVGMLMVTGIKFIISAPEGKADAKKRIVPWAIGVVLLFSVRTFVQFFMSLGMGMNY